MANLPVLPSLTQERACGSCSLCCRLLPVPQLQKDAGRWCPDCRPGAARGGCGIHETRPDVCRAFNCQWVQGRGEAGWRPDLSGVLVCGLADLATGRALVLYLDRLPLNRAGEWALLYWATQALALGVALVAYAPLDGLVLQQVAGVAGLAAEQVDPETWHWETARDGGRV